MKKIFLLFVVSLSLVFCSDKIVGEGDVTMKSVAVPEGANTISVKSAMQLVLSDEVAEGELELWANENIHGYIDVLISDSKVEIDLESSNYKNLYIKVIASAEQFSSIKASGASSVVVKGTPVSHESYIISLSGVSSLDVETSLDVKDCNITMSGASEIYSNSFVSDDLTISISGASELTMGVNNSVSGTLSGASKLNYWGDASLAVETTGASKVSKITQ